MDNERMKYYSCYTLVDITKTNVLSTFNPSELPFVDGANHGITTEEEWNVSRNQQRNWETLLQLIGLRTQPMEISAPTSLNNIALKQYKFGKHYTSNETVWTFTFGVEHTNVFATPEDPLGALRKDIDHVPIITGLLETADINPPVFVTYADFTNIYFEEIPLNTK